MSSLAINKGKEVFATVFTGTVGLRELARKVAGGVRELIRNQDPQIKGDYRPLHVPRRAPSLPTRHL